jgi:hypothetical protein
MNEDTTIVKDDSIAIEAYLHTRSLHELARNGQLEGKYTAHFIDTYQFKFFKSWFTMNC